MGGYGDSGVMGVLQLLFGGKGKGKGNKGPNLNKYDAEKKVWVGNLPTDKPTWKELNELFKTVAHVKWVQPLGKKGEACIAFATAADASTAIAKLNGAMIRDNPIQVDAWGKKD